jgi:ABC-type transporter Mla maintaining outer membrane lipid asymmetry permease subunit MlaE
MFDDIHSPPIPLPTQGQQLIPLETLITSPLKKVVFPLVISCSIFYPLLCETIVYIFTITEISALFLWAENHNVTLDN